jgi:hypothetical protein
MMTRRLRVVVAQCMLGVVLFAQAAIASAACDLERASPARAFAQTASPPCHEETKQNANLCLAHCLSADQSTDTPQLVVPAWIGAAPLAIAVVVPVRDRVLGLQHVLPHPAAPPPRILFQSFLI